MSIPDPPGRVIRTPNVRAGEALVMPGSMFSDSKSRVYVPDTMTDEQVEKLEQAILDHEKMQRTIAAIIDITERAYPTPQPPTRQAMILDYPDGHREYSPEVEVSGTPGDLTINPIIPFRRITEGENHA